jgi:hypothetical protein
MTVIWIDRQRITANKTRREHGQELLPCVKVKSPTGLKYAREVVVHGPSTVRYDVNGSAQCGASAWIETDAPVEVIE